MVVPPARDHHKYEEGPKGRTKKFEEVDVRPRVRGEPFFTRGISVVVGHGNEDKKR